MRVRPAIAIAPFVAAAALLFGSAAQADSQAIVAPIGPGQYAVGCNDVSQDFSRVMPGESAQDYWEGNPDGNRARYVTSLLSDPGRSFVTTVAIPDDSELYGRYAGDGIDVVTIVCYPTRADNPRADYVLPNGTSVPHMQRNGEAPLWPEQSRLPVLLFSHGLGGSPLSDDYMNAIKVFASHGYVVVAPFHGDRRVADVKIGDLSDAIYALRHFEDYVAMQALRPLELSRSARRISRTSRLARPRRAQPDRRIRRESRRRIGAADGRRATDDDDRHVVEAGAQRPRESRRPSVTFRTSASRSTRRSGATSEAWTT